MLLKTATVGRSFRLEEKSFLMFKIPKKSEFGGVGLK